MAAKLSGSGGGRYDLGANNEINVTPFVDVMLVLLIIFMVAAPLATVSVEVKLPSASLKPVQNPPKPVFISLQKNGHMYVGDIPTDVDHVAEAVKNQLPKNHAGLAADERIYIRADGEVVYMDFMHLVSALQDKGYYSVALVELDSNGRHH